jgi:hypothetical protein
MPLYRLTFKRKDGEVSKFVQVPNVLAIFECPRAVLKLIKIERINRVTMKAMRGIYDE